MRKRTRWKMHEVFRAITLAEGYQRSCENARYSRKRLANEIEAKKWDENANLYIEQLKSMGLTEIISDIKSCLT